MRGLTLEKFGTLVFATALGSAACGGPAPEPKSASSAAGEAPAAAPSTAAPAPSGDGEVRASTVRFEDLGISFTVPPGYRVLGDEELASRIHAAADVKLNRSLRDRAAQRKGLPLLTLERTTTDPNDFLTVSLSVVLVPKDARATELIAHEQAVMAEHLAGFKLVEGPKERAVAGVPGAEIVSQYLIKRSGEARRAASTLRLYVRDGIATVAVAVWPEGSSPRGEEARLVLDGLTFENAKVASR
jgi:hypothetical protein